MFALKKKKTSSLLGFFAVIAAVALVSVSVTWAAMEIYEYLGQNRNTNVFTIGNVDIDLIDVYEQKNDVEPETQVDKKVAVKNTGTIPCFVRVYLKKGWTVTGGKTDPGEAKIIPEISADGIAGTYGNSDKWVKGDNPYGALTDTTDSMYKYKTYDCWYYQSPIAAGAETDPLFTHFHLAQPDDGKPYASMKGSIAVMAEAVQYKYISEYVTKTAGKITGWPGKVGDVTLEYKAKEA